MIFADLANWTFSIREIKHKSGWLTNLYCQSKCRISYARKKLPPKISKNSVNHEIARDHHTSIQSHPFRVITWFSRNNNLINQFFSKWKNNRKYFFLHTLSPKVKTHSAQPCSSPWLVHRSGDRVLDLSKPPLSTQCPLTLLFLNPPPRALPASSTASEHKRRSLVHPIVQLWRSTSGTGHPKPVFTLCSYHFRTAPTCSHQPRTGPSIHPHPQLPLFIIPPLQWITDVLQEIAFAAFFSPF